MTGLNENQRKIAETLEGMLVVDAGPGTGKTHTITERYLNLLRKGVDPADILMVTFTRNSAQEMRSRIRKAIIKEGNALRKNDDPNGARILAARDEVRTSTFDAYCLRTVLSSPDAVSDFFGFKETLSRGAVLVENDTLNKEYFSSFYAEFSKSFGHAYSKDGEDIPALLAEHTGELYHLMVRLMSFGLIPLADDTWFQDGWDRLLGNPDEAFRRLKDLGVPAGELDPKKQYVPDLPEGLHYGKKGAPQSIPDDTIRMVAYENRNRLAHFIWHVYYEYIRQSVRDNRLTFSLVKIFAFAALYESDFVREQNSVDYMMVDEFQDTDEMQLLIALMLLRKGNLCVVGDWKQGIYAFRNASVDNILSFKKKVMRFVDMLGGRVQFDFYEQPYAAESLNVNYRSTQAILDPSFRAMWAKATNDEHVHLEEGSVTELSPYRESPEEPKSGLYLENTGFECWSSESKDKEYSDIVDKITEYVYSGKYHIVNEDGTVRNPNFGDIGVLFKTVRCCNLLFEEAERRGIPVFLQGDTEIMSSKPGKLVLAWLRFINDSRDRRGIGAILVHEGYMLPQIRRMFGDDEEDGDEQKDLLTRIPQYLVRERDYLYTKRRRPNELLTSIFAFHRIGEGDGLADIAQAIINVVSSSYNGSLMTIPDIIRLFEEDIEDPSRYGIDAIIGSGAVTVQTMHKSKGLEYPIVIVGAVNDGKMPYIKPDKSVIVYDPVYGIRCKKEFIVASDGTQGIVDSWRYTVLSKDRKLDYDSERRLLFVSMTRAQQYLMVASGPNPSKFFTHVTDVGNVKCERPVRYEVDERDRSDRTEPAPAIPEYKRRRTNLGVHDIMTYVEGADASGRGKKYGQMVHDAAQQMVLGKEYDSSLPETVMVRRVLDSLKGAKLTAEYDCALPVGDVTLRGTIDLLADFGDRIEIHDWKTDTDRRNLDSYILQLSVYAHAASQAANVPVRCFIDFVSVGETYEVTPVPMEEIGTRVFEVMNPSASIGQ